MNYYGFLLSFPNGYHTSNFRLSDSEISITADTLFSALINEANNINGQKEVDKLVGLFRNERLKISDAFPFVGKEYFIPKPLIITEKEKNDQDFRKKFKKISFLPLSSLDSIWNGSIDIEEINNILDDMGAFQTSDKIHYMHNGEHEIYTFSWFKFRPDNGLYFILGFDEEENLDYFDGIMNSLQYSGIGGKKTLGYGRFEYTYDKLPSTLLDVIDTKNSIHMLLTTSIPRPDEMESVIDGAGYKLIRRGGFIFPKEDSKYSYTKRKMDMYFFESGSIFRNTFKGDIFNVSRNFEYDVFRYSMPIFMGVDRWLK